MRTLRLGQTHLITSRLALGCMRLGGSWDATPSTAADLAKAVAALRAALDAGYTAIDHADIYCLGKSESLFADAVASLGLRREQLVLISKCGIRFGGGLPTRYDFSYDWIVSSVEGSLRRLRTDHLDLLLLHRPDALMEPEETARAITRLLDQGKIRAIGVSNHTPAQIALLQRHLLVPIAVNQIELSLVRHEAISDGILANQGRAGHAGVDGLVDYCRLHHITLQAWSPLAGGALGDHDKTEPRLRAALVALAKHHGVSAEAIAIAWLLRHPAGIQPVIGSTDPGRIRDLANADKIDLGREDWYGLLEAARGAGAP